MCGCCGGGNSRWIRWVILFALAMGLFYSYRG